MMECRRRWSKTKATSMPPRSSCQSGLARRKEGGPRAAEGTLTVERSGFPVLVEINCETDFVARSDEFRPCPRRGQGALSSSGRTSRPWCRRIPAPARSRKSASPCREDRREHRRAPLRARHRAGALEPIFTARGSVPWSRCRRRRGVGARSRHAHRRSNPAYVDAGAVPAEVLDKEPRDPHRADQGQKSRPRSRQDGRGASCASSWRRSRCSAPFVKDRRQVEKS